MTFFKDINIAAGDSPSIDAFGRWRTSEPYALFSSMHEYTDSPEFWETITAGSGTSAHVANQAAVRLRTTTASGDRVVRQTYRYFRYTPGKSQLVLLTGVMGSAINNVRKRLGYFDDNNGLFFEQNGTTGFYVTTRTFTSGSVSESRVEQANWNIDRMDGTGPSQVTLDFSKSLIFIIDFEWLGVGRARMGFVVDGKIYYCHEFLNTNNLSVVYMSTPNLPLRYEIENIGTVATATNDMFQICSTVVSEGGNEAELQARMRSASNGTTTIGVSTRRAVLSIRPSATINGFTNRAYIQPIAIDFANTGNNSVYIEIIRGGTLGGTPSWTSAGTNSAVEFDVAGTTVTGGERIYSSFVGAVANGRVNIPLDILANSDLQIGRNANGANPTIFSIVATAFGGTQNCSASITWKEVY